MANRTPVAERVLWQLRDLVLSRPNSRGFSFDGPISIVGLFRTASGIGQAARACAEGFEAVGIAIHRVDLSEAFDQVDLPPDPRLSSKPLPGGTLIVHFNAPEFERALFLCDNWRGAQRRVIGCWVWEMPTAPPEWALATKFLSEVWVPSQFTYEALRPLTDKPMRVVPHYISPCKAEPRKEQGRGLRVISFADGKSSFARKNVLAALRAFQKSDLTGSCELVLKVRNLDRSPTTKDILYSASSNDSRVRIIDASLPSTEVMALISESDILLSLHRAEGFGLTIAEAMLRAKPVIATGWSGNLDFMNSNCAVIVPYRLTPVDDTCGVYTAWQGAVWAEPDIDFAAASLSMLARDPERRLALGQAARKNVLSLTTGQFYREALESDYPMAPSPLIQTI